MKRLVPPTLDYVNASLWSHGHKILDTQNTCLTRKEEFTIVCSLLNCSLFCTANGVTEALIAYYHNKSPTYGRTCALHPNQHSWTIMEPIYIHTYNIQNLKSQPTCVINSLVLMHSAISIISPSLILWHYAQLYYYVVHSLSFEDNFGKKRGLNKLLNNPSPFPVSATSTNCGRGWLQ